MKYTSSKNARLVGKNGRPVILKKQHKLTKAQVNNLTRRQLESYTYVAKNKVRVLYLESEIIDIFKLYLINDNVTWVRDSYLTANPSCPHSIDSINALIGQIRTLDTHYPNDTQWDVKRLTKKVAESIDPVRFGQVVQPKVKLTELMDKVDIQAVITLNTQDLKDALSYFIDVK